MPGEELSTMFAPPERAADSEIDGLSRHIRANPLVPTMLDSVPIGVVALNRNRQIVFANRSMLAAAGLKDQAPVLGLRPGEALQCVHAGAGAAGCGTSEFCRTCGAVKAILASQEGRPDVQECRLTRNPRGEALDLRVSATPFDLGGVPLTIFAMSDISEEKRRRALERIFFHDILNTAGGIKGFSELLKDAGVEKASQYKDVIFSLARMIVDEINSQRTLLNAENNELTITPGAVRSLQLLSEVVELYRHHESAAGRNILIDPKAEDAVLETDRALLQRVLGNMIKNALEACKPGDNVTAGCEASGGRIDFLVHNPGEMPREVQLQIFQRSFSTKGVGRGLGTYSIKLLTERYLNGTASFTTGPGGTTFKVSYPQALGQARQGAGIG